jgi:cytochrome c553
MEYMQKRFKLCSEGRLVSRETLAYTEEGNKLLEESTMTFHTKIRSFCIIGLLSITLLALTACGSTSSKSGGNETSSSALDGPAETMQLFKQKCVSCHATDLKGRMGPDTDLTQIGTKMTQEQIVTQITEGSTRMPAFKKMLETTEIDQLAEWLATKK